MKFGQNMYKSLQNCCMCVYVLKLHPKLKWTRFSCFWRPCFNLAIFRQVRWNLGKNDAWSALRPMKCSFFKGYIFRFFSDKLAQIWAKICLRLIHLWMRQPHKIHLAQGWAISGPRDTCSLPQRFQWPTEAFRNKLSRLKFPWTYHSKC